MRLVVVAGSIYVRSLTPTRKMPATNTNHRSPAPRTARWAAGAKRWAAAVAAATCAVWVARLALGVYEAETALAARLRVVRPAAAPGLWCSTARSAWTRARAPPTRRRRLSSWRPAHSAARRRRGDRSRCSREPRAVTAPKRRAHSAAYGGVRHSTAPTTAPAVPVWYDEADEAAAVSHGRTAWPWSACAVRSLASAPDDAAP